jgi:hypothetical protein
MQSVAMGMAFSSPAIYLLDAILILYRSELKFSTGKKGETEDKKPSNYKYYTNQTREWSITYITTPTFTPIPPNEEGLHTH